MGCCVSSAVPPTPPSKDPPRPSPDPQELAVVPPTGQESTVSQPQHEIAHEAAPTVANQANHAPAVPFSSSGTTTAESNIAVVDPEVHNSQPSDVCPAPLVSDFGITPTQSPQATPDNAMPNVIEAEADDTLAVVQVASVEDSDTAHGRVTVEMPVPRAVAALRKQSQAVLSASPHTLSEGAWSPTFSNFSGSLPNSPLSGEIPFEALPPTDVVAATPIAADVLAELRMERAGLTPVVNKALANLARTDISAEDSRMLDDESESVDTSVPRPADSTPQTSYSAASLNITADTPALGERHLLNDDRADLFDASPPPILQPSALCATPDVRRLANEQPATDLSPNSMCLSVESGVETTPQMPVIVDPEETPPSSDMQSVTSPQPPAIIDEDGHLNSVEQPAVQDAVPAAVATPEAHNQPEEPYSPGPEPFAPAALATSITNSGDGASDALSIPPRTSHVQQRFVVGDDHSARSTPSLLSNVSPVKERPLSRSSGVYSRMCRYVDWTDVSQLRSILMLHKVYVM